MQPTNKLGIAPPVHRRRAWLIGGASCVIARVAHAAPERVLEEAHSSYNHIIVTERGTVRTMYFVVEGRRLIESQYDTARPASLDLAVFRTMVAGLLVHPTPKRLLMIGVGGGQLSNYLFRRVPNLEIDAVDIDPEVIRLARSYFGIPADPSYRTHTADGRLFVERSTERWDMIVLDAFRGVSVPRHLRTRQYYDACLRKLQPGGVIVANLHTRATRFPHDLATFAAVFPHTYTFASRRSGETTLVASTRPDRLGVYDLLRNADTLQHGFDIDLRDLASRHQIRPQTTGGRIVEDAFDPQDLEAKADRANRHCPPECG